MTYKIFWMMSIPLFICTIAIAQEQNETKTIAELRDMSLEDLLNVTVTVASRTEETSNQAPSSVTVLTRKEFSTMGITSVEELLNFVPGFLATRETVSGDGYRVVARGQTTPQYSYNVLFLINGQRINSDLAGGALEFNRFLTLANIEQVEVIRGPGSALYGTSAFNGVVNIVTTTKENQAVVKGGNLGQREAHLNVSKEEGNWKGSLFLGYSKDDGDKYTNFAHVQIPNYSSLQKDSRETQDVYATLSWKNQLRMNFRHAHWEVGPFGGWWRWLAVKGGQDSGSLSYQLVNTDTAKLVFEAMYTRSEFVGDVEWINAQTIQRLPPGVVIGSQEPLLLKRLETEQEWEWGLNGHYRLSDHHRLYAGFSFRRPEIDVFHDEFNYDVSQFNIYSYAGKLFYSGTSTEVPRGQEGHRRVFGAYLQDQYQFNSSLNMTLGVRHDNYSDFGGTTHPRLALIYQFTPDTSFKFMYGEAFRAPSVSQLSATGGLGNSNLEPEEIKTTEVAWLQRYAMTQTTITYFKNHAQKRIDTVLVSPTDRKFVNLDTLDTNGWEVETLANFTQGLSLRMGYTYLSKSESPRRFPRQTVSMIANYQTGPWNFNLNTYYHDTIVQEIVGGTVPVESYWMANGTVRYALSKGIAIVGTVNNLLDKASYSPSKISNFPKGIPNRGRSYMIGIESTF